MKKLKYGLVATAGGALALYGWDRLAQARDERRGALPGDEVVPNAMIQATHDLVIDAPASDVWPWIVQMGYGKGGWYLDDPWWRSATSPAVIMMMSDDERAGHAPQALESTEVILPEYQHLAVGDTVPDGPPGTASFTVDRLEPERLLVLHSNSELRLVVPHQLRGRLGLEGEFSWTFLLEPIGSAQTRLTTRVRIWFEPTWLRITRPFFRVADRRVQRGILRGIRRRVELTASSPIVDPEDAEAYQLV